ncbi:MAG: 2-isopropylmalate synthase [Nitrospirae bacterium]|nr:MAG: 2-isopropylmalate synthase [Nitrospirota bacterium]
MRRIKIFDTTLRDGEQSPGASMYVDEKVALAKQLARLGVDVIEAGFAISSSGDFEAISRIAEEVEGPVICSLARAKEEDIKEAWNAIKNAKKKRIHTFFSTSDIHLKYQFGISREEALKRSVEMVKCAKSYVDDVEFSPMDATRTDPEYLCEVVEAVIEAGAKTVNIPDTVGYSIPTEFGSLIAKIKSSVKNIDKAVISVHCHNDLGLAVANSLSAVLNGAGQIECTVNGLGERAGNCAMEEVVMALKTRSDIFKADTNINTEEIYRTSRLVSKITGIYVQPNKAIVGSNAFSHESGIHQDGLLKERITYEIMRPEMIGLKQSNLVLGKHSGRKAFKDRLIKLGYELTEEELNRAFLRFKELADQKKEIFDDDIDALVADEILKIPETYKMESLIVTCGMHIKSMAAIKLKTINGDVETVAEGCGPVDATYNAIVKAVGKKGILKKYEVKAITGGTDALGEVMVHLEEDGFNVRGHGSDTDIVVASAKAYINALNKIEAKKNKVIYGKK